MSDDIRPFRIAVSDADLDDLHQRLDRTRWPHALPGVGWERGVPADELEPLVAYWRDEYDWRLQEERLNAFGQFMTRSTASRSTSCTSGPIGRTRSRC